jgi:hypothetical protein
MSVLTWLHAHWAVIATILFLVSELLGETQSIRENSIFGVVREFLRGESEKTSEDLAKVLKHK